MFEKLRSTGLFLYMGKKNPAAVCGICKEAVLAPELIYEPDDEYYHKYYHKNSNGHPGLENIAYQFAAGKCG